MSRITRPLIASLAALAALAPAAQGKTYDVAAVMGDQLPGLLEQTSLSVLVPSRLALDTDRRLFSETTVQDTSWEVTLAGAKDCGGANACTLAWLSARAGAKRDNPVRVRLAGGRNGWFRDLSCGASCSPPSIQFTRAKVLYEIQAKVYAKGRTTKRLLIDAANSAVAAGPR